jgi:VCBS repeat-containing protein
MGSRTSSKLNSSRGTVALFLAAAAFLSGTEGSAEQGPDDLNVQGGWAYAERSKDGKVEHVAATRAAEDAVWLMLACGTDGRLTVSFVHSEQFAFPLKSLFLVKLHSNNVPTALFEAKSIEYNQIVVAPLLMRHIMPLLMQEEEIVVSIPERDGAVHDYTFSMQPNDLALRPIRSCLDF